MLFPTGNFVLDVLAEFCTECCYYIIFSTFFINSFEIFKISPGTSESESVEYHFPLDSHDYSPNPNKHSYEANDSDVSGILSEQMF